MNTFYDNMNASPWKGIVSEAGLGLEFSSRFLRVPGASETIMSIECPYDSYGKPSNMRAVSLENARRLAQENLGESIRRLRLRRHEDDGIVSAFGLAITGAHYNNRDSHVWVFLATNEWNAYMHFAIATSSDREWVGRVVDDRVKWFLNACFLSNRPWSQHIRDIEDSLETHNIDVLYAPGVSDAERLLLLKPNNPLAFQQGEFVRVVDVIRKYPTIYAGSFNPPTKKHLNVGEVLYEISQTHVCKPPASIESMLHRVRMLDAENKTVLLTQAPLYVDKYRVISYANDAVFTFLLGADSWNLLASTPCNQENDNPMPNAGFNIMPRSGITIDEISPYGKSLCCWPLQSDQYDGQSSTAVRNSYAPAKHEFLTEAVAEYILDHGLYQ